MNPGILPGFDASGGSSERRPVFLGRPIASTSAAVGLTAVGNLSMNVPLTANVPARPFNLSGRGCLNMLVVNQQSGSVQNLVVKLVIDGVTTFQTIEASTASGAGFIICGLYQVGNGAGSMAPQPLYFTNSCYVEIVSSTGGFNATAIFNYELHNSV